MSPLPPELDALWNEALTHPNRSIDIGRLVVCDSCDKDYTDLPDQGGIVVGSYGYGPCCAARMLDGLRRYNEMHALRARCPPGQSYADFIRAYRGPAGNTI